MNGSKVGILSDTHDNMWATQAIVSRFIEAGVDMVLHCGDFISPFNAKNFSRLECPWVGVYGNNDGERLGLQKMFSSVGPIHVGPYALRAGGRNLLMMHEPGPLEALGRSGEFDAVLYGHTHDIDNHTVQHADKNGSTLILNPGEGGGWLSDKATAMILDLERMCADVIEVPHHP